ncbi:MAG TPA: ABC transporter permease subunit, partial [Roseiflexaceae bacterium]|nr:ABC transporter permease subunit [Roseiflexaceae bacterium]
LRWSADDFVMCAGLVLLLLFLLVFIGVPLWALLSKGFQDKTGEYVGLANFLAYFRTGAPLDSLKHSLTVSALATAIVVPLAFVYAYALTRSCMALKGLFGALALIPILAPSLLPALSLVYIFGNQGFLKVLLFGDSVYGPIGIVIAQVFYCFPFAVMILVTALRIADGRLYEAADALGASRMRIFWTVTLPGAKYGLVSAAFVVFTLVITDFGIPKVIGGQYNVLSTDVYKQVIGQQNFEMGAVVGLVLLVPAILSFGVDRLVQRRQVAMLSARAVPLVPKPSPAFDRTMFAFCAIVAGLLLFVLLVAVWGSFVSFWPYNLSLSLKNYDFATHDDSGWRSYWHSLEMAAWTALAGTLVVFSGGWLIEKSKG